MAWEDITNGEIDQDSPVTVTLMTKYRDNVLSLLELDDTDVPRFVGGFRKPASGGITGDLSAGVAAIDLPLSSTAKAHMVLFSLGFVTGNNYLLARLSSDGGTTFRSTSTYRSISQTLSGTLETSNALSAFRLGTTNVTEDAFSAANERIWGHILIDEASDSNTYTRLTGQETHHDSSGAIRSTIFAGIADDLAADDYIRLFMNAGNIDDGYALVMSLEN